MKTCALQTMPADVAEMITARGFNLGLRHLIVDQWNCTIAYEVGDRVRFEQTAGFAYYPPSMPFKNATGTVVQVIDGDNGRGWAVMQLDDGRRYCAPMCWLWLVPLTS